MKITTFILIISLMQVSAASFGQRVTLKQRGITLEDVFREIRNQTGYDVLVGTNKFQISQKIDANFQDSQLTDVMDKIVTVSGLSYTIEGKTVVIREKETPSVLDRVINRLSVIDLSGYVSDSTGRPLSGVTVKVKEQKDIIGITNQIGDFKLKGVPNTGTLIVSMVGYITQELKYYTAEPLNIRLKASNSSLDEIKVIAYGTTTKRLSTSNISSIKAKDIAEQPNNNPLLALQGRVPGIYIQQASGNPGTDISVRIQGNNSIANGNDPFYVIDGVPFTSKMLSPIGAIFGGNGGSPLNFINSSDIESIEILKDADATAIYGSKAANGAILITTKKGAPGKTSVDLNLQSGWGKVPHFMKLLNTPQYLELRNEALRNDGMIPGLYDYDLNGVWSQTQTTDWQKTLIGGTAKYNDLHAGISGGSQNTQFNLAANYHRETTVTPGNFSNNKGSVSLNLNHRSENSKFQMQLTANYLQDLNRLSIFDLTSNALKLSPNAPSMYNPDGSINFAPTADGTSTFTDNPAILIDQRYHNSTNNLVSNLLVSYEILPRLKIKSSFGYNKLQSSERTEVPLTSIPPDFFIRNRSAIYSNKEISTWIIEPQLSYNRTTAIGNFEFLLGSTFQKTSSDLVALQGTGYNSDLQLSSITSASSISSWDNLLAQYNYNAVFGRINYNLNNEFILNFTMRRDGSSRFGSENLFQNFFSAGGAWIFTEQNWIKEKIPVLTYGKIKVSYGTTGNDQIGDYKFLSLYSPIYGITVPYQGIQPIGATGHASPFIQWEETRKFNLGLDLSFLDSKFDISLNYFRNRSTNQLLNYPLSFTTGFVSVLRNIPAKVQNTGLEGLVNVRISQSRDFKWTASVNATFPQNKLLVFPNLADYPSYANSLVIGEPITISKVFKSAGVNEQTGIYEFFDSNGNRTYEPNSLTDKTVYVNPAVPSLYGGLQNSFTYKRFEFNFLVQAVRQTGTNYRTFNTIGAINQQPISALERWKEPGDHTDIQRGNSSLSYYGQYFYNNDSDAGYTDASFIRVKNVSLSYSLPKSLITRARLDKARIFLLGQNLLTLTKYKGLDPETGLTASLPALRVFTIGIQINL